MSPFECVSLLQKNPLSLAMLRRLNAGLMEFQDAWFGLCLEFGLFVEILRVLHRLYLSSESELLLVVLQMYSTIFDAVWKTVLVTHGSVPVMVRYLSGQGLQAEAFHTEYGDDAAEEKIAEKAPIADAEAPV